MLQKIDDRLGKVLPLRFRQGSPVRAGKKKNIGLGRFPGCDVFPRVKPGIRFVPLRFRTEGDARLVRVRGEKVIEIIPNFHVSAGKLAEIAMEQNNLLQFH